MRPYPRHVCAFVDFGSREAAATAMDRLCVARDLAESEDRDEDAAACRAGILELKASIAACGWHLRFDPTLPGHVVETRRQESARNS